MRPATGTGCRTSCSRRWRAGVRSWPARSAQSGWPCVTVRRGCRWRRATRPRCARRSSASRAIVHWRRAWVVRRARVSSRSSSSEHAPTACWPASRMPMRERSSIVARRAASVAYVLKAYPRLSETYIHSEIHRLEQLGLPLRLYSIKPVEESERGPRHPVVERIKAQPVYLPEVGSVSGVSAIRWLRRNVRPFLGPLARCLRRRPTGLCKAALAALAQAVRARPRWSAPPRKIYLKEFLQAVALSDYVSAAPDVRQLHAHYAHGSTTVAWLASQITGLPFSFTAHAKDVYSEDLNPAGLLRRKLLAARFAVTCTEAGAEHMRRIAPEARIHVIYHGLVEDLR